VVPYSPIARGVLTGKYAPGSPLPRARGPVAATSACCRPSSAKNRCDRAAAQGTLRARGVSLLALRHGLGAGPPGRQLGHRRAAHAGAVADYLGALDVVIDADDEALVDSLVAPGHPSTPGYNDPAYPLAGR
jgi:aryl-alcohol dehydrogenase-like predicted oxidoreductase